MDNLLSRIQLRNRQTGERCDASIVVLTRELAASKIDGLWWLLKGELRGQPRDEDDHHWVWRKLVGEHRNQLAWHFVACQTPDAEIQGAVGYRIDFRSILVPEAGSVYVDRIAVAPRNRSWLVSNPLYGGVGEGLLLHSVCRSYILGLGGRVTWFRSQASERDGFTSGEVSLG